MSSTKIKWWSEFSASTFQKQKQSKYHNCTQNQSSISLLIVFENVCQKIKIAIGIKFEENLRVGRIQKKNKNKKQTYTNKLILKEIKEKFETAIYSY